MFCGLFSCSWLFWVFFLKGRHQGGGGHQGETKNPVGSSASAARQGCVSLQRAEPRSPSAPCSLLIQAQPSAAFWMISDFAVKGDS